MKRLLASLLLFIACHTRGDQYVFGTNCALTGQSGWSVYTGGDTVFPTFFGNLLAGTNYIDGTIPITVPVGVSRVYFNGGNYSYHHNFSLPHYPGTVTNIADSSDVYTKYWSSTPIQLTNSGGISNTLTFRIARTNDPSLTGQWINYGVFITTNLTGTINSDGYLVDWPAWVAGTNAPIAGNRTHDGGFETFGLGGWGIVQSYRTNQFREFFRSNSAVAWQGVGYLEVPTDATAQFQSRIYRIRPNLTNVVSVYAKSSGPASLNAVVGAQNITLPPSGVGLSNRQAVSSQVLVTTNWTRIAVTNVLYAYPSAEFRLTLQAKVNGTNVGTILFDGLQFEEGNVSTTWAPHSGVEVGLFTDAVANVFTNETATVIARVYNSGASASNVTVGWRTMGRENNARWWGTTNVTVAATSATNIYLTTPGNDFGWNRIHAWLEEVDGSDDELQYGVLPIHRGTNNMVGTHTNPDTWNLLLTDRIGFKWMRGLSITQTEQWSTGETNPGVFTYYDSQVTNINARMTYMANIGALTPSWAMRTFLQLTNQSALFAVGDTVASATATGIVTYASELASYIGHSIQMSNTVGTFVSNQALTATGGKTATARTGPNSNTPDLGRWRTFVNQMSLHYGTNVWGREVWNEPDQDVTVRWAPFGRYSFYAEMLKIALETSKSNAPSVQTVAFGGIATAAVATNILGLLSTNDLAKIDLLSFHLYDPNGSIAWNNVTSLVSYGKPIWNTESGLWCKGNILGPNGTVFFQGVPVIGWSDSKWMHAHATTAPKLTAKNIFQSLGSGMTRHFYYDTRTTSRLPDDFASHPGGLDTDDTFMPKIFVAAILNRLLSGSQGLGRVMPPPHTNVEAYVFSYGNEGSMIAAWSTNGSLYNWSSASVNTNALQCLDFYGNPTSDLKLGRYAKLFISTTNHAGLSNAFAGSTVAAVTDVIPPVITITRGPRGQTSNTNEVRFRWFGTDNVTEPSEWQPDLISYSWRLYPTETDFTPWSEQVFYTYTDLPSGGYRFEVRAKDEAGNISATDSRDFWIGGTRIIQRVPITRSTLTNAVINVGN